MRWRSCAPNTADRLRLRRLLATSSQISVLPPDCSRSSATTAGTKLWRTRSRQGGAAGAGACRMHRLRNDERERPQLIAAAAAVAAPTFLIRAALLLRLSGDVAAGYWLEPVDQVGHLVFRFAPVEHRRCGNLRRRDIHVAVRTCRNSIGSDHLRIARIGTVLAIGANSTDGFGLDGCQIEVARIVDREPAVVWLVGVRAIPSITTPCLASLSHTTMLDGTPKLLIERTKPSGTFPPFFLVGMGQAILCYVGAGRMDYARRLMADCVRQAPAWRRSTAVPPPWVRSPKLRAEFMDAFIKAGLPD